jgi:branched-chain amino acid transport system permease protein
VGGRTLFFVIQALSLVMLVGWGGQVSLMQGAYVGVGALGTGYLVVEHELALWLALLLSAVAGTAMGAIAGIPALRLSGLQFAVASLAFTGAAAAWLFERPEIPSSLARSDLFGIDLASDTSIYYVMLALTGLLMLAAANLRRSVQGRFLIAARDAPEAVEHFGASATRARMGVFLVAAFTATLGGGLYAVLISGLSPTDFAPMLSLSLLVYTVVGGSQSLVGPVMAGLAFGLLPQITQSTAGGSANAVPDIIAGATVILVLVFRPGGLADLVPRPRLAPAVPTASTVDVAAAVRERLRDVAPPTASATLAAARSHLHQPTNPGEPRARGAFRAPVA